MIRRKKIDILPFLPRKTRKTFVLEKPAKEPLEEIRRLLQNSTDTSGNVSTMETFMQAFRLTCSSKIPTVCNFLQHYLIDDTLRPDNRSRPTNALVFFHHTAMRLALEKLFSDNQIPFFCIHGGTCQADRKVYETQFQDQEIFRVGLLSIGAACTGLTLHRANVVVFTETLFGPDMMFQAEDRVHRIGQEIPVCVVYLLSPGTTDRINWGLVLKKSRESDKILHGEQTTDSIKDNRRGSDSGYKGTRGKVRRRNRVLTKAMMQRRQSKTPYTTPVITTKA
jgi:SWI/SNF-related matrix-associated actin-dependent regulator 1 of chromatin subfamily A